MRHYTNGSTHQYVLTHTEVAILRAGLCANGTATLRIIEDDGSEGTAIFDAVADTRTSKPPMAEHVAAGDL